MLVSLHQGLFSYYGKIRDSCSVFRGVRLLQTVSLITAGGSAAFSISAARGVIRTATTTWGVVWVFHIALIVGGNVFHHLAVAVVTGNLDGGFLQLALDVNAWGEDYTAVGNQTGSHFAYGRHTLGSYAESHGSQSRNGYGMAFGTPRLDNLACCIPANLHYAHANAASDSSLLDHLALRELVVKFGTEDESVLTLHFAYLDKGLLCFQINCHNLLNFKLL